MPTTYRATVKTGSVRTRYMLPASFTREFKRNSCAALAECTAAFVQLLADNIPADYSGATAWLERSDARGYTTALARYSGKPTACDRTSGRELAGTWTLEEWHDSGGSSEDDGLPDFVHAGRAPVSEAK
jgi:hypothetical protein